MRRFGTRLLACALLGVSLVTGVARAGDVLGIEPLADKVPAFTLQSAAGGAPLTNTALLGKSVLLHFWATWCTPCKEELPALDRYAAGLDPQRHVVLLVAIDTNASTAEVLSYARGLGVKLPVYVAASGGVSDSFWGWGLPVSYLIDAQGQFVGRLRGPRNWSEPAVQQAVAALQGPSTVR